MTPLKLTAREADRLEKSNETALRATTDYFSTKAMNIVDAKDITTSISARLDLSQEIAEEATKQSFDGMIEANTNGIEALTAFVHTYNRKVANIVDIAA